MPSARVRLTAAAPLSWVRNVAPVHPRKRYRVVVLHPGCFGPIRTKAPGCIGSLRLRSPSHPRGPITKTRVRLVRCLQCVPYQVLGSEVDCWPAEWCQCHASREGSNHTRSVEHVVPLPTWKTYRKVPELKCYTTGSARYISSGVGQEGTGLSPVSGFLPWHPRRSPASSSPSCYLDPLPSIGVSLPPRFLLSTLPSPLPPPLVRVPPVSTSPPSST